MLFRTRPAATCRGTRIPALRQSTRVVIVVALLGGSLGSQQMARPMLLSVDSRADAVVRHCLANALGTVARFTDTEAYAAVDPRNANRVVAVWQTGSGSGSAIQWSRSSDGGKNWTAARAAPMN